MKLQNLLLATVITFGLPSFFAPDTASAATKTWDGSANGYLSNGANWVGGVAPVNGDDLVFPASGVSRFNVTNNFLGGPRFRSLRFEGYGFNLSGAYLVLSNGIGAHNLAGINRVNCALQLAAGQTFFINGDTGALLDINGDVALGPYSLTVSAGGGNLYITGDISGTGGLTKISGGTVRLDGPGTNTYSGLTTIIGGTLELSKGPVAGAVAVPGDLTLGITGAVDADVVRFLKNNQLGSNTDVIIGQAGWLDLNFTSAGVRTLVMTGGRVSGGTLMLNGNVTATSAPGIPAVISGSLLLGNGTRAFTVNNNATEPDLNIDAAIRGMGGIIKTGAGTLAFSGSSSNSYFGGTRVNEGTLVLRRTLFDRSIPGNLFVGDGVGPAKSDIVRLEHFSQINNQSAVIIASSGWLDQNGISEAVGSLTGEGHVEVRGNSLGVGIDGGSTTYSGIIAGAGGLTKMGLGTLNLTGNNSYGGPTLVVDGTLLVNGAQHFSDANVTGGTLGGTGAVENITLSGKLTPNTDGLPGTLHGSSLSCSPLSHLFFDLNDGIPGTGTDMVTVTGNVALNHATLHVSVDYPPFEGQRFRIINSVSPNPVSGTFAGLPNGSVLTADGVQFVVLYNSVGNGVELVATNTPLRFKGSFRLSGGNLNARLDPNECNLVDIVVSNAAAAPITGVRATLVPHTGGVSATQPFASYPDLAPGTMATNRTPFQISLLPGFVCGTVVVCDLLMETDNYGPFRFSIGLGTGLPGVRVRFDHNTPEPIPDFSTLDSTVHVSGINSAIYDVAVSLHITHPSVGDLDISLISPAGTLINLSSDNGGAGANYGTGSADNERTMFADVVSNPTIGSGAAPFVGRFRPEVPLSVLRYDHSEEVNGVWTLRVADDTGGNVGTLQGWSLFLTPAACTPSGGSCESCPERTILGSISGQSQAQMGRLIRDHHPSACSVAKTCPGAESLATQRRFDAYTFENGESNACITVSLGVNSRDDGELFSAAYLDGFNPANVCQNYLADLGADVRTGQTNNYSFDIAAGARFVIVVSAKEPTSTLSRYRLDVLGGSCRPLLNIRDVISARAALSWSTAAVDYQLERLSALPISSAASWLPVTNNPVVTNGRFCVTNLVAPDSTRFYRLRQP